MSTGPAALPLRDIHLPPAVSWWPPAPAWWYLAALLLILSLAALGFWLRYRRHRARRAAVAALARIEARFASDRDGHAYARALSQLLRRVAMLYGGSRAAAATERHWLELLAGLAGEAVPDTLDAVLLVAPYSAERAARIEQPVYASAGALVKRWFDALPPPPAARARLRHVHV